MRWEEGQWGLKETRERRSKPLQNRPIPKSATIGKRKKGKGSRLERQNDYDRNSGSWYKYSVIKGKYFHAVFRA